MKPETKLKRKLEEYKSKDEVVRNRHMNWIDVSDKGNFKTPLGEASIKGLQNNDRGERHLNREDEEDEPHYDLNHLHYYSTNLIDKYKDA